MTNPESPLVLHHVGCAVPLIEPALIPYTQAMQFARVSDVIEITSQSVRVCFVEVAPGVFIELVEGTSEASPVAAFLKRRQYFYHVCYSTPDVAQTVARLEQHRFRCLSVFASEAFGGTQCAFLLTPEQALVELCTAGSLTARFAESRSG